MAESSAQPNGHKPAASDGEAGVAPEQDQVRRDILPIPDAKHVGLTTYDAKDPDTTYPPITALRPPKGAPNVLVVMLDDVGFGGSSAFGVLPILLPDVAGRLGNSYAVFSSG